MLLLGAVGLSGACQSKAAGATPTLMPSMLPAASPTGTPTETPSTPAKAEAAVNPLTGLPVADESLLKIPAVLVSISHFPATGRPQAGLSFAPFVYEFYITEGATRFLTVLYGELPAPALPAVGGCAPRTATFVQTGILLGNRVWLDANGNGLQDPGEGGVSGLCVNLYDHDGILVQRTSTDSNGFYGFNVDPRQYSVEFVKARNLEFTVAHAGDDARDSDADPASGRASVEASSNRLSVDAGLIPESGAGPIPEPVSGLPKAQVGPIRSGRLIYRYIGGYFKNSCLIYAGASPEELPLLPKCLLVFHQVEGGGVMLDLSDLLAVAKENEKKKGSDFDYSSNIYSADPPANGLAATQLRVYIAYQNQSGWFYDPLAQAYFRYVDTSDFHAAGILHPDTDRLTTRQLHFENVIVLFTQHQVISPTNLDIHLNEGRVGKALLFRDGQVFTITWSTVQDKNTAGTGAHPIRFLRPDGQLMPLKPGHTWVIVVTPESTVDENTAGQWVLTFSQPPRAK
jgi:hypothetical protein